MPLHRLGVNRVQRIGSCQIYCVTGTRHPEPGSRYVTLVTSIMTHVTPAPGTRRRTIQTVGCGHKHQAEYKSWAGQQCSWTRMPSGWRSSRRSGGEGWPPVWYQVDSDQTFAILSATRQHQHQALSSDDSWARKSKSPGDTQSRQTQPL